MSKHRALLIGIPKYSSKAIPPLPFIQSDMKRLKKALESSGYAVRSIGQDKRSLATPGEIRGSIHEFCTEAEKNEKLIICFSGHGVHFEGESYLVPYDARIDDSNLRPYLISVEDFKKEFENSRAETILFFVDACREGIELGTMAMGISPFKSWDPRKLKISKEREVAFIFSCSAGEVSRFIRKKSEAFSLFSRALAETIRSDNPVSTFGEVAENLQENLNKLADEYGKQRQTIDTRFNKRLYNREIFEKTNSSKLIKGEIRRHRDMLLDQIAEQFPLDSNLFKLIQDIKSNYRKISIPGGKVLSTGWLPSPPDNRDYTENSGSINPIIKQLGLKGSKYVLASSIDLRRWFSPIENQKNLESSTAISAAGLFEYFQQRAYGNPVKVSSLFIYKNARNLMDITSGDTGAFLRTTLVSLRIFGAPQEKHWPYTDQDPDFDREPSNFAYNVAQRYYGNFFRHDPGALENKSIDVLHNVKKYLAGGIPSIFGFFIFSSFNRSDIKGGIPLPCSNEKAQWGHSVVAVGYDDNLKITNINCDEVTTGALLVRNSWGTEWGVEGYGWLPYDYILKGLALDFWSILQMDWIETGAFGIT